MKLLITGCGRIASNLAWHAERQGHAATITYRTNEPNIAGVTAVKCDIRNLQDTTRIIEAINPDIIIHSAALTNHNLCETDNELAHHVNVAGTKNLVRGALASSAGFIFLSTDNVFNGKRGCYKESDIPDPLCYFAKTKLEAEREIAVSGLLRHAIVRTGPVYGWCRLSFSWNAESPLESLIRAGKNSEKIVLFEDEVRSMILIDSLSASLLRIAGQMESARVFSSMYHIGGEAVNRYEFGIRVAKHFGIDRELIRRGTIDADWRGLAQRPKNCSLDTSFAIESGVLENQDDLLNLDNLSSRDFF
ncbi:hypothetical protein A3J90_01405 [candidate division WOR-1 bacterium RIFOXYC2_FULL_37_10]|uniref:RmlD-like substrate binding domain-containing protein n=1 Tax=candidate division WOR-1 bacterium RIFOXYB2_FULL_37_13 TaxID=1802579 RepID=A0A1F4ST05_UNCSA|nr:MAG: hypothetical protein A2246_05955 [candidate division WOR-1 bacterium RIFOXYA2_FULL_37_7]OGC23558.1 MAG: hypothetical protein A2310_03075 [candidate division WOR-1 bacterium RIFOXYB2_FULL_37_13]OGC35769.1 MAG: hypothetical protein A3J90_01405 [candidate division WOR-1 bacterium RIFOXYC2_FULL_37_10]